MYPTHCIFVSSSGSLALLAQGLAALDAQAWAGRHRPPADVPPRLDALVAWALALEADIYFALALKTNACRLLGQLLRCGREWRAYCRLRPTEHSSTHWSRRLGGVTNARGALLAAAVQFLDKLPLWNGRGEPSDARRLAAVAYFEVSCPVRPVSDFKLTAWCDGSCWQSWWP